MAGDPYHMAAVLFAPKRNVEVTIEGPGLGPEGKSILFGSMIQADAAVQLLNHAFLEGFREGIEVVRQRPA